MAQCWPNRAALLVDRTLDRVNGQPCWPKSQRADLRDQLVALRAALVGRLVQRNDGGDIVLLGSVGAAIATPCRSTGATG
jgi:hypothetical protein